MIQNVYNMMLDTCSGILNSALVVIEEEEGNLDEVGNMS